MLCIIGASGKLGFATLSALVGHDLVAADQIVCTTSSDRGREKLAKVSKDLHIRNADWDNSVEQWRETLQSCVKLFLISSARIEKDFGDPYPSLGREADHFKVLEAASQTGVDHVYYTSLAFANPSKSRVMTAHERTERWLQDHSMPYTLLREGLYSESWPLYFGHYAVGSDKRREVVVSGDSKINWTSIPDLGLANAVILTDSAASWVGKMVYLAQNQAHSLSELAALLSKAQDRKVELAITSREEYERYYIDDQGFDAGMIRWWSRTYDALLDNECQIHDATLEQLLGRKSVQPEALEATITRMLAPGT